MFGSSCINVIGAFDTNGVRHTATGAETSQARNGAALCFVMNLDFSSSLMMADAACIIAEVSVTAIREFFRRALAAVD